MARAVAVVRKGHLAELEGCAEPMNAASLVKPILAHLAMAMVDDLDTRVYGEITVRHILSHTTGLPNWRTDGGPLRTLRPPGTRWGYSGEAYVLLQRHLEKRFGRSIDELAAERVFVPRGMLQTSFGAPKPGYHGYRPLATTAADYGRFLAFVLSIQDERWEPQCFIDGELAWGGGWGLELGSPLYAWQWGLEEDANNFVIGCPETGDGVVVLTADPDGDVFYRDVVRQVLPSDHASLRLEHNATWIRLFV